MLSNYRGPTFGTGEHFQQVKLAPFDEIRLVDIQPGNLQDEIHCNTSAHSLESPPEYEALSYVWGDPEKPKPVIHLNGITNFPITANLFRALRQLRYEDRPRRMWIDQLCINQTDHEERRSQVRQMSFIFERAQRVCLWLGDVDDLHATRSEDEMEVVGALKHVISTEDHEHWYQRAWIMQEFALATQLPKVIFGPYEKEWKDVQDLAYRQITSLSSLLKLDEWYVFVLQLGKYELLRDQKGEFPANLHFYSILLRDAKTRNDEDKVYCILASLPEAEQEFIDSSADRTPNAVFSRATYASICSSGGLGILSLLPQLSHGDFTQRPSWVVDFTFPERPSFRIHLGEGGWRARTLGPIFSKSQQVVDVSLYWLFNFSQRTTKGDHEMSWCRNHPETRVQVEPLDSENPRILSVKGLHFDIVQDVVEVDGGLNWWASSFLSGTMQIFSQTFRPNSTGPFVGALDWYSLTAIEKRIMSTMETRLAQGSPYVKVQQQQPVHADPPLLLPHSTSPHKIRFFVLGAMFRRWDKQARPRGARPILEASVPELIKLALQTKWSEWTGAAEPFDGMEPMEAFRVALFKLYLQMGTRGLTFFITASTFIGLGPPDLRSDDRIVLLYGSRYPIALRRSPDGHGWLFVGFCYVRSIMDHELSECFPRFDLDEKVFHLV